MRKVGGKGNTEKNTDGRKFLLNSGRMTLGN